MHLTELTDDERRVLLWLVATLADIDDDIDEGEVQELQYLASALEIDLVSELRAALDAYSDNEEGLADARQSVRIAARDTIRQVLTDLMNADGVRMPEEHALLNALEHAWR
jgi:hypothetical protein